VTVVNLHHMNILTTNRSSFVHEILQLSVWLHLQRYETVEKLPLISTHKKQERTVS